MLLRNGPTRAETPIQTSGAGFYHLSRKPRSEIEEGENGGLDHLIQAEEKISILSFFFLLLSLFGRERERESKRECLWAY